eukprot:gene13961-16237_t
MNATPCYTSDSWKYWSVRAEEPAAAVVAVEDARDI